MTDQFSLWPDSEMPRSASKLPEGNFKSLQYPLWTRNKARLIQEYLRLFIMVTRHGAYIDGFAAPQRVTAPDAWAAKLALEMEPKWLRNFWLCDINPNGVKLLKALRDEHIAPGRRIAVIAGDFNRTVREVLGSGRITETTATFALLDQRTFECEWQTVQTLARHKSTTKIELFYFLATGWIDRSIKAVKAPATIAKVERWWGRGDWRELCGMDSTARAMMVARRFGQELGYGLAKPYPIHSEERGGRVMYHMIHATDHPDGTPFMVRAYRKVSGRSDLHPALLQPDFNELWSAVESDSD